MVVMVVIAPTFPLIGGMGGVGGKKRMVVVNQFPVLSTQTCYLPLMPCPSIWW
jgi:hypothetical protein